MKKGVTLIEVAIILCIISCFIALLLPICMYSFAREEFDAKVISKRERVRNGNTEYLVDVLKYNHSLPETLLNNRNDYSATIQVQLKEDKIYHFVVIPSDGPYELANIVKVEPLE